MIDYKKIHRNLQNEFDQDRTNSLVANQLAIACMEINDYKEAFRFFKMNSQLNPSVESLTNMAYFYFHEGEPNNEDGGWFNREEDAIKLLKRVLLLDLNSEIPSALLGEIYFATDSLVEAKKALEISIQIKPTFGNQHNLGSTLYRLGLLEEASILFLRAHHMKNEYYRYLTLYNYVVCQIKLDSFPEQAIRELENAQGNDYTEVDNDRLADIYYEMNHYSKVVDAYERTKLWYSPDWVLPYFYSLVQCGLLEKANEIRNNALMKIAERIKDCDEDEDEEFTVEDRQRCKNEIETDKQAYLQGFQSL